MTIQMVLLLGAALGVTTVIHVCTMGVTAWLLGATVEEISLFTFTLIRFAYRGVKYEIGVIPFGGHVKMKGESDKPKVAPAEVLFTSDVEPPVFGELHPLRRVAICGSGCLALIILASVCVGPWAAVRSLGRGFVQATPFAPWTPAWVPEGRELARQFLLLFKNPSFPVILGVLAAKLGAGSLLPMPTLNGGQIIVILVGWKKGLPDKLRAALMYAGLALVLLLMIYWVATLAIVVLRG